MKYDYCIVCNKKTKYRINEHIKNRMYYIEGAGQLCEKCFKKLFYLKN